MEENIKRIELKLDRISERIGSIDITLGAQHVSLKDHIRRTELLEKELQPIQNHVVMVQGAFKLIAFISVIAIIVQGAVEFLHFIGK